METGMVGGILNRLEVAGVVDTHLVVVQTVQGEPDEDKQHD